MHILRFGFVYKKQINDLDLKQRLVEREASYFKKVILIIWIGTIFIGEIRTFSINENKVIKAKFKKFFNNSWNTIEYCAVILFTIGLILRFIPNSYDSYLAARILWCIDIILWFIKILYGYTLNRNLGPKLFMIKKMV